MICDFGVVIPMANESNEFDAFTKSLSQVLNKLNCGKVYLIIDNASKDNTLVLCKNLTAIDNRYITIWAPENRNVVEAYLRGYSEAVANNHDYIIEMDAGLSHDPEELPSFINALKQGYDCVFGSRFIKGGSIHHSTWRRTFLSKTGTILSNILLGTKMHDMTSGYQGFHFRIVKKFLAYKFLSKAHFYQTELRFLLRHSRFIEIPIHYRAPSPSVSKKAIINSIAVLLFYFFQRIKLRNPEIK